MNTDICVESSSIPCSWFHFQSIPVSVRARRGLFFEPCGLALLALLAAVQAFAPPRRDRAHDVALVLFGMQLCVKRTQWRADNVRSLNVL